ncbi:MAG: DUF364 domain-containing protein [Bacteroidetes bacterium]|nr:DUF364 domain-containing protein [Bacteroidota bacterium]
MIINETYNLLKAKYKDQIENLTISDVRIGIHLTAVKLSDNSVGVSATLSEDLSYCPRLNRDYGDFTPSRIKGQKALDLFDTEKKSYAIDTLRIAVLNAFSSKILSAANYKIVENTDPIDLIDLTQTKTITIVGAFQSYIHKIAETRNKLYVLELNEKSLAGEDKRFYVPANEYKRVLPVSDIVIITGLTLVNNTIDGLLASIAPGAQIVVTGPSSSVIPDSLFRHNVNMIGATRITDPDLLFTIVGEGGAGYHLFKYCAQKICIIHE